MYTGAGEFQYVAAYAVQVLEFLETFNQEVEWVWRKPWSWITCVFLFVRYGSLAAQAVILYQHLYSTANPQTRTQCFKWVILRAFTPTVFVLCIHGILIARVYALYNRSRRLLLILVLLLISGNIFATGLFSRLLSRPLEYNSRCEVHYVSDKTTYVWACIVPFCLDVAILFLTIKRALVLNRQPHPIPILKTIIVDGTWAVFVVWSSVFVSIVLAAFGHVRASYIVANSWMITILSFAVTRTILNIRRYNAPTLSLPDGRSARTEEHRLSLTAYVPAEETLALKSRNNFP